MKKIMLFIMIVASYNLYAGHKPAEQWQQTTLPDSAIKHIQKAKYTYKKCVTEAINKILSARLDSRKATDIVMKQCEQVLTDTRQVFIDEKIPEPIADRYLKQTRTQTARNTLKHLMFVDAARKMGQVNK